MTNARKYSAGIVPALLSLSQGSCYWPDCTEPTTRFVDGVPINNYEIAHICAATEGGPRHVPDMTDDDRHHFDNLVLLCLVHHKIVDKIRPEDFSIEILRSWKLVRETPGQAALKGLRGLTEERLQELIIDSFGVVEDHIQDSITRLAAVDREAAELLRPLVDDLGRVLAGVPNEEVASWLVSAGDKLANIEEPASWLAEAGGKLGNLHETAATLAQAANTLASLNLPEVAANLLAAAQKIENAGDLLS